MEIHARFDNLISFFLDDWETVFAMLNVIQGSKLRTVK